MNIVSLLPSATEIVCSIGARPWLVGVTHECDFPASVSGLPVVTRSVIPAGLDSARIDSMVREQLTTEQALYTLRTDVLERLQPDLIVSQSLCDVCAVSAHAVEAAACELPGNPRVINLEPSSLGEVLDTMLEVGQATDRATAAQATVAALNGRIERVRERSARLPAHAKPRVAVLEWLNPLFNAGHWTPELVAWAGGVDVTGSLHQPSTTLSWEQLAVVDPDVIVIALCGFDLDRTLVDVEAVSRRPQWQALTAVRTGRVYVADGNAYFSRPGPRLVESLELLAHALHPQVHQPAAGGVRAFRVGALDRTHASASR